MLNKIGGFLYPRVFVNIIFNNTGLSVYVEKFKKSLSVESIEKKFSVTAIDSEIIDYIESFTKDTPYFYISILDYSTYQGAIPTCNGTEMQMFYDRSSSKELCYGEKWAFYTSKFDLDDIQREYRDLGLDFIFSPIVVLAKFFKDKIDNNFSMYILIQDSFITLSIFDHGQLLFAKHIDVEHSEKNELSLADEHVEEVRLDDDEDTSIDLEDVDIDDALDDLDGFGDIEDLDSIEEIDEFSDVNEDDNEEFELGGEREFSSVSEESFNEDYQRFLNIQEIVKRYYEDERYERKFVESVYIADSIGLNEDLKSYLEEEMFLNVYIRKIQIGEIMSELVQEELK
ncbi:MAG: hypothetical protein JXQ66_04170 [Campylobacterales bacterium]|nr:hypothetical protein [Campylobacterales bacterium]